MDKNALLARRLGTTAEVPIPGVGTVRVRGLSRQELLGTDTSTSALVMERRMLALALVDPQLTEDEVAEWQASSPAEEITPVVHKINELSGIKSGAVRAAYKRIRG